MTEMTESTPHDTGDRAPGYEPLQGQAIAQSLGSYLIGLALAVGLTAASFYIAGGRLIWGPAIPVALIVLAIAQMGVHLVFFLHITTGPDSTNNVLALAFGVLIVVLLIAGSLWIMANLNHYMMPTGPGMEMRR
jgi:cytochrome o ubiquinol oxidase operon protein cyoD